MLPSHFIADNLPGNTGYTWTLTTRLGAILREVESCYGARDQTWTILGVEFGPNNPRLWYPGDCKHIAIQLAMNAADNIGFACYQIAHECIHLLSPCGGKSAILIEEGLATVFSEDYAKREFQMTVAASLASYTNAAKLVRELLSLEPNAIRMLRGIAPSFHNFTPDTFVQAGLNAPQELISELLVPFSRE